MEVYNIRRAKYAKTLKASGVANRWNKDEEFVIYTGSSIALSTLELVVHRQALNLMVDYKILFIQPNVDPKDITIVERRQLPKNWNSIVSYPQTQRIGSEWYQSRGSLVLKVPSVIVKWEYNFLINTKHPDFETKVSIVKVEDYFWDDRLIEFN